MKVTIRSLLRGARRATGHVVLIDVFTSSTLITTLLERGAAWVRPLQSAREGRTLRDRQPEIILMGERWGKKLPGFDHNTAAIQANRLEVAGLGVVLSTTNGTLGILSARGAERLFIGCLRNASAVARRLAGASEITLVPIGLLHGTIRTIEDELCAVTIQRCLLDERLRFDETVRRIRADLSSRVRSIGRRRDRDFCLELDATDVVPELRGDVIVAT